MSIDLTAVGGRRVIRGAEDTWHFGWKAPDEYTPENRTGVANSLLAMPGRFQLSGTDQAPGDKICLWDFWKHPDVLAANGGKVYSGNHQLTGSCFPAGVPVRMADGTETRIEDVHVGDSVIGHTGQSRKVVRTFNRRYTGDLVTIQASGFAFPLTMTADHPVAVVESRCAWRWQPGGIVWKLAGDLEEGDRVLIGWSRRQKNNPTLDAADYLGELAMDLDDLMEAGIAPVSNVPMAQCVCRKSGVDWKGRIKLRRSRTENAILRHMPLSPSFARLIGLYLAEGGCHNGRVVFTFDRKEDNLVAETMALVRGLFGVEGEVCQSDARPTSTQVRFTSTTLEAFFKGFVTGNVYSKRVPGVFFSADEETKLALILGWLHGDGYAAERKGGKGVTRIQGVTASQGLARDMAVLALSCGIKTSVSRRKPRGHSREAFDVFLSGPRALTLFPALAATIATKQKRRNETDTNRTRFGYARTISRIIHAPVTDLPVYDIEVEEDHSFLAMDMVVHNCVGAGGGNAVYCLAAIEVARLRDPEIALVPFWPLPYGRSRYHLGDRREGEGSTGATFAKAMLEDGIIPANAPGLPGYTDQGDGITYTRAIEMKWSDGDNPDTMRLLPEARKHLVRTAAPCRSADDVREALRNGYPCTAAGDWGGLMQCEVRGTPPVLLNRRQGTWMHQQSIHGWWDHPELGELFYWLNQWGTRVHGICPSGAPPGGYWTKKADVDYQCRNGEVFAFSQFNGFPAQTLKVDWVLW